MFTPYPDDPVRAGLRRIHEVVNFTSTWSIQDIPYADSEQQREWLRWAQCLITDTPTQQFSDLFPQVAIFHYRDTYGRQLPGLRAYPRDATSNEKWHRFMNEARRQGQFALGEPMVYWKYLPPDSASIGLCDQENYLRIKALPAAIHLLMWAFQNQCRVRLQEEAESAGLTSRMHQEL